MNNFVCLLHHVALLRYFEKTVADNPEKSRAIAAIQTLIEYLKQDSGKFVLEWN